jgi:hypothetical protein
MFWSAGRSFLRAEGFSCSFCVLYGGLGISKLQFFIKKNINFFSAVNFFQFLVIKTLDLELDPESGYALNQCGSTTLLTVGAQSIARA